MMLRQDKLRVATDGFINSKQGRVEFYEISRQAIQWAL